MPQAQLLTASCTTGWADWIHSELWLFDDGLLVVKQGLGRTIANGVGPTVTASRVSREFTPQERAELPTAAASNMWIASSSLEEASFHSGILTGRVNLTVAGERVKLLWLENDHTEVGLREALERWNVSVRTD